MEEEIIKILDSHLSNYWHSLLPCTKENIAKEITEHIFKREICDCGKPLVPVLKDGEQIGVTHTPIDEEHHLEYFSIDEINKRIESN